MSRSFIPTTSGKFLSYDFNGRPSQDMAVDHIWSAGYAPIAPIDQQNNQVETLPPIVGNGSAADPIQLEPCAIPGDFLISDGVGYTCGGIVGTAPVSTTYDGTNWVISSSSPSANFSCVGTGSCILSNAVAPDIEFKTITASSEVNLTNSLTEINIGLAAGDNCDQLQYVNSSWQIIQTPAWSQATVGTANAAYPSVTAAFAAGCRFVRITTDGVFEPGGNIVLPVTASYLIYIDPGVTYALTLPTVLGDSSLSIRGSGNSSVFRYTFNNSAVCFSGANAVLDIDRVTIHNASDANETAICSPSIILRMSACRVVLPNRSGAFIGSLFLPDVTSVSLEQVDVISSGTNTDYIISAGVNSNITIYGMTISGTVPFSDSLVCFSPKLIIDGLDCANATNSMNLRLAGTLSNINAPNAELFLEVGNCTVSNSTTLDILVAGSNIKLSNIQTQLIVFSDTNPLTNSVLSNIIVPQGFQNLALAGNGTGNVFNNILVNNTQNTDLYLGTNCQWNNIHFVDSFNIQGATNCSITNWSSGSVSITGTDINITNMVVPFLTLVGSNMQVTNSQFVNITSVSQDIHLANNIITGTATITGDRTLVTNCQFPTNGATPTFSGVDAHCSNVLVGNAAGLGSNIIFGGLRSCSIGCTTNDPIVSTVVLGNQLW